MRVRYRIVAAIGCWLCPTLVAPGPALAQSAPPPIAVDGLRSGADDFMVTAGATDAAGLSRGQPGFTRASLKGECRVYIDNVTPVTSDELYDRAFVHLDEAVQAAGGIEEIVKNPDKIPAALIWSDSSAPWRCVAGTIYNVQVAGYLTVGFIFAPDAVDGTPSLLRVAYIELPFVGEEEREATNRIVLTAQDKILWNGNEIAPAAFRATLEQVGALVPEPALEFEPEADVSYAAAARVLDMISKAQVEVVEFTGIERHRAFGKAKAR